MIELQDGMLLYHGSYIGIPAIWIYVNTLNTKS